MNRTWHAAALLAVSAGSALAQSFTTDSTITLSMAWSDNGAGNGNNNGVLEPGEAALITLRASFSDQFGTGHFSPPISGLSAGTVLGFGSAEIDINGSGGTEGDFNNSMPLANTSGTSGYGVRGGWRSQLPGSNGTLTGTGISWILMYQFVPSPDLAVTMNPISNIYRFLWTPASYTPRSVTFASAGASIAGPYIASVYLDLGNGTGAGVYMAPGHIDFGSVNIPIVPAPGALALTGTLLLARRRRCPRRHPH